MKKNLMIAIFLFLGVVSLAQTQRKQTISGTIKDSTTRQAMPYSTVLVKDSTQKLIASTYASDRGNFELRLSSGNYKLLFGFTGYTPDSMMVSVGQTALDVGTIFLKEGIELGTVQIIGQIVTTDIDKTSYNTAADPETPALTGLELMRKVPMITVDGEDNIQLKGQENYLILVNGKPSSMMSKNYKDILKAMPASSIKTIEVITNPPAKYDAEGIGGIINIVTNRKLPSGYNGSLRLSAGTDGFYSGGGYIGAQLGKFNVSLNFYAGGGKSRPSWSNSTRIDSLQNDRHRIESNGTSGSRGRSNIGGNFEASYDIDSVNLLTFGFGAYGGSNNSFNESTTDFFDRMDNLTARYRSVGNSKYQYIGYDANLNYQRLFKRPDQTFTFAYQFNSGLDNSSSNTELINDYNYPDTYSRRNTGAENSGSHTIQIDYFDPITKEHQIETGLKYTFRPNGSDNNNEIMQGSIWVPDNRLKNDIDYDQHIGSFYGGYALKLKWLSAKAGFRGELTINQGVVKMINDGNPNNIPLFNRYFNIVPYLTLNFKLNESQAIRIGYTQRLRRPNIWNLNPYINDLEPTSISSGNSNLESTVNNSVNLNYSINKQKWNFGLSATYFSSDNPIFYIKTLVEPGQFPDNKYVGRLWSRPENIGNSQALILNANASVRLLDNKLNFGGNLSGAYSYNDAPSINLHNEGFMYNLRFNAGGSPWKGGNISLYYNYSSPYIDVQDTGSAYTYYGMSINQSFFDRKLTLSFYCSNPFEETRSRWNESRGAGFYNMSNYTNYSSSFNLSVMWRFGKSDISVKQVRRGISNDDSTGDKNSGS